MKMKFNFKFMFQLLAALLLCVWPSFAVEPAFKIRGRVLDLTGAGMAGAVVTAEPEQGGPSLATRADGQGAFQLVLGPGAYTLRAQAPGFLRASRRVVAAASGEAALELVLPVAPVEVSVTVEAPGGYR